MILGIFSGDLGDPGDRQQGSWGSWGSWGSSVGILEILDIFIGDLGEVGDPADLQRGPPPGLILKSGVPHLVTTLVCTVGYNFWLACWCGIWLSR